MKQLIVNADDFGLTKGVSHGILDAHRGGLVTSATLMANGEAFDWAVHISRRNPRLGVGVHLNLTQGKPVVPPSEIPTLVDAKGHLYLRPGRLLQGLVTRQVKLREIETELRAQISKVLSGGIAPTHLDGHKHVHVLPGVSDIVIHLALEFGIPSVRCPMEMTPNLKPLLHRAAVYGSAVLKQYLLARAVALFARRFKDRLIQAGLKFPSQFYGLSQTGFLNADVLGGILRRLPEGTSELMCHPGYVDPALLKTRTRLLRQREAEIRALTAIKVKKLTAIQRIELVNYRTLAGRVGSSDVAA